MINRVDNRLAVDSGGGMSLSSSPLKDWLNHDLAAAIDVDRSVAVFVVRIDDYQALASQCGGEELPVLMAKLGSRLKKMLRAADALFNSADDSFTIVHPFDGDPLALHGTAKSILQKLQRPIRLGEDVRRPAASIGVAFYPEDGNSAELLLERAHNALSRTDRWGGNGFCLHSRLAARHVADELSKHEDLRRALDTGALSMRYQPILDLSRNCMTAVSGETRWQHPEHGLMGKTDTASIAKRAGLEFRLNEWMIGDICRQLVDWRKAGIDRSVCVDVSPSEISDCRLVNLLSNQLSAPGVTADLLEVRLDHDALLAETDHRIRTGLRNLADLGVTLSLSRIGQSPLAFQCLQKLPFHAACLAPDMIAAIGRCSSTETMLGAMIGFLQGLGLSIRAVDVRSQIQVDFLRDHGCDEAAGPYFAPALKGVDIDRLTNFSPRIGGREEIMLMPQQISMH